MDSIELKYQKLKRQFKKLNSLIVAYSGGIDSALLLKVAYEVLGEHVLAVTADSPSVPRGELEEAKRIAKIIGVRHVIIKTSEMQVENYVQNSTNRCYFCKSELYSKLIEIARRENISYIANGTNLDDLGDYRPGLQAAQEFQVISPLKEANLTKEDIRALAKQLHLEIWDKPATPCLSSRIPYGNEVTTKKLAMIEAAEDFLKSLNIRELRVRHFGHRARIETHPEDFEIIQKNFQSISARFNRIGFHEIELQEFKSGALNNLRVI
ncbi:MAG: ATP-dependent sacrificial sulfur transferase LarE [bacterium]